MSACTIWLYATKVWIMSAIFLETWVTSSHIIQPRHAKASLHSLNESLESWNQALLMKVFGSENQHLDLSYEPVIMVTEALQKPKKREIERKLPPKRRSHRKKVFLEGSAGFLRVGLTYVSFNCSPSPSEWTRYTSWCPVLSAPHLLSCSQWQPLPTP